MNILDRHTLIFLTVGVTTLLTWILFILKSPSKQVKYTRIWAFGSLVVSFSMIVSLYRADLGNYLVNVLGRTSSIIGLLLYYIGTSKYNRNPIKIRAVFIIIGLSFLQENIFYLYYFPKISFSLFSFFSIYATSILLIEFLKMRKKGYYVVSTIGIVSTTIYILVVVIRMISIIQSVTMNDSEVSATIMLVVYIVVLSQLALAFVFVILFNLRLAESIRDQLYNRNKLFSIIAHDLSGPVTTMSEMLTMINKKEEYSQDYKRTLLEDLEKLSKSTSLLLYNLLHWSKTQINKIVVEKTQININKIIQQNITLLKPNAIKKSIEIIYENQKEIFCIADYSMVDTVLRNLISNAIKFTPNSGKININVQKISTSTVVEIADTGIGIDYEIIESIHNNNQINKSSFGTNGEKGVGLGLALCNDFMQKNNGEMIIKPNNGEGTTIVLTFPNKQISAGKHR